MANNYLNDMQCKFPKPPAVIKGKDGKRPFDPTKDVFRLNDGDGMFLLCQPNGSRLWRMKYTLNGKTKMASFGKYPDVSLADAREKRGEARKLVAKKIDPVEAKREVKEEIQNTFGVVAKSWYDSQKGGWTDRHSKAVWRSLELDTLPTLKDTPIKDVTGSMALKIAEAVITERGAYVMAHKVLRRITEILGYAVAHDHIDSNPATGMAKYLTKRDKATIKKMASIHWKQLPVFLKAIDESDMFAQTELALRLLMLTWVRPGEIRYAKWDEFDIDKAMWTIPAERMKMNKAHKIPLSTQAVEILEKLKVFSGDSDFVLPGRMTAKKPISENTILFAIYRIGYKDQMTAHGCRALASTWLNEEGMYQFNGQPRPFNADAIERQLAHGEPNKVRDVYNRADYLGEREIMMQVWADYIDQCADQSGKVVPLIVRKS